MFKVGDMIAGLDDGYLNANENMKKAEVIYKNGYPATMGIRILEHTNEKCIGLEVEIEDRDTMFKLIE